MILETWQLLVVAFAALLVGFAKSGVPGSGILIVPVLAMIADGDRIATIDTVGLLLPMLIVGDIFAVSYYKRHAQWDKLRKLFPWVAPGMLLGYLFLLFARDRNIELAPLLGGIVLAMVIVDLLRMKYTWATMPDQLWFIGGTGSLAGFTTTVGNAAGSIMNLYFLSLKMPKEKFVGTAAWFFMIVNLAKVPLYLQNDMISGASLKINVMMIPAIAVGAVIGMLLLPVIPQKLFNLVVRILTAVAAIKLITSWA